MGHQSSDLKVNMAHIFGAGEMEGNLKRDVFRKHASLNTQITPMTTSSHTTGNRASTLHTPAPKHHCSDQVLFASILLQLIKRFSFLLFSPLSCSAEFMLYPGSSQGSEAGERDTP